VSELIVVDRLVKEFLDPKGETVRAVDGVSFRCAAGAVFGLLGLNGAGKTTTLRMLSTVLSPTEGTATLAGYDIRREPRAVRASIGFLSGTTGLYHRLTARETLRRPRKIGTRVLRDREICRSTLRQTLDRNETESQHRQGSRPRSADSHS
jgi:ABC-type Na+ transport system ATPase subunit NatA